MLRSLLFLVAASCAGTSTTPAAPSAPVPTESIPGATESVGAVPLPDPNAAPYPLDEIDTTVALGSLPGPTAAWAERITAAHAGRVLLALATRHDDERTEGLYLFVVATELPPDSDYPDTVEGWRLSTIDPVMPRANDGNAFMPHYRRDDNGDDHAPLKFAIRFLPRTNAPEAERMQLAIYSAGTSVLVAEKLLGTSTWKPRLRVDMPRATEFVPIAPGWH